LEPRRLLAFAPPAAPATGRAIPSPRPSWPASSLCEQRIGSDRGRLLLASSGCVPSAVAQDFSSSSFSRRSPSLRSVSKRPAVLRLEQTLQRPRGLWRTTHRPTGSCARPGGLEEAPLRALIPCGGLRPPRAARCRPLASTIIQLGSWMKRTDTVSGPSRRIEPEVSSSSSAKFARELGPFNRARVGGAR